MERGGKARTLLEGSGGCFRRDLQGGGQGDARSSPRLGTQMGNCIPNSAGVSGRTSQSLAQRASLLPKLGLLTAADCLIATA